MRIARIITSVSKLFLLSGCVSNTSAYFKSERLSRTATITINESIDNVFPLFGAFEERKVDDNWNPELIYPDAEKMEEGTTFRTHVQQGRSTGEKEFIWHVTHYQPEHYLVQYLVSTSNRLWRVKVICLPVAEHQTNVTVTYTYVGLNQRGNELNRKAIEAMFKYNLKDWEEGINHYLRTGHAINEPRETQGRIPNKSNH